MARQRGFIVLYRVLSRAGKPNADKLLRGLNGYDDKSNFGKYVYRRPGFLERFPHVKLIRGALIVRKENAEDLVKFLETFDAEVHVREVFLNEDDEKALGLR
jgi:hypothetical protein